MYRLSSCQVSFESIKKVYGENKCYLLQMNSAANSQNVNEDVYKTMFKFKKHNSFFCNPDVTIKGHQDILEVNHDVGDFNPAVNHLEAIPHPLSPIESNEIGVIVSLNFYF